MKTKTKTKTDIKDRFVVIMAGGRGERFWPVSREQSPKQLIKLWGDRSFLQQAVDRVMPLVPAKNVFVITNATQAAAVRKQLPRLPRENIVAEPMGRDTCAAVTLGAALVGARSTTGVMAVLPADHVVPEEKKFQQVLADAFDLASRGQAILTIGIKPTEPATGYGYIRVGEALPPPPGVKAYRTVFHRAEQFVEKPHFDRALEYVNSGQYRWNAGMFIWSFVTITEGLQKHQPEMYAACQRWFKVANQPAKLAQVLAKEYPDVKRISIDYALMEHAQNVVWPTAPLPGTIWVPGPRWRVISKPTPKAIARWRISSTWMARGTSFSMRAANRAGRRSRWSVCAMRFWCRPTTPSCWPTKVRRKR